MTKRGKRSKYAVLRRSASHIVQENAHIDYDKGEQINVLTKADLYDRLYEKHGFMDARVLLEYERGEILSDPRGDGSHQRREAE